MSSTNNFKPFVKLIGVYEFIDYGVSPKTYYYGSSANITGRYASHLTDAHSDPKYGLDKRLAEDPHHIIFRIVELCDTEAIAVDREKWIIATAIVAGKKLYNIRLTSMNDNEYIWPLTLEAARKQADLDLAQKQTSSQIDEAVCEPSSVTREIKRRRTWTDEQKKIQSRTLKDAWRKKKECTRQPLQTIELHITGSNRA